MFALYGKLLGCLEEVLFNELIQYLEYTTKVLKTCQTVSESECTHIGMDSIEQDDLPDEGTGQNRSKTLRLSMPNALAATPKRFVTVRKLLQIAATMTLTSYMKRCFSAM